MIDQKVVPLLHTTKKHASLLHSLGIITVSDFLHYFPRTHTDERQLQKICDIRTDMPNVVKGILSNIVTKWSRQGKFLMQALLTDETGSIAVVWFNQPHLSKLLKSGDEVILSGKAKYGFGKTTLSNPKFELIGNTQIHTARIVPVYHETEGMTSKWFREKFHQLLPWTEHFQEYLPVEILGRQQFISYAEAVRQIHFPEDEKHLLQAKKRLAFDELFVIQFTTLQKRWQWRKGMGNFFKPIVIDALLVDSFIKNLPFILTNAQKKTITDLMADLAGDYPMLRLLQGDVGSGKTIVAIVASLALIKAGYQVAVMAPTEILAKQHFKTFQKFLANFKINIQLLVGSLPPLEKKAIQEMIRSGTVDLVIGTHALIQESVNFKKLGLVVVDEQHRFGVLQREKLQKQGSPHLLNLSATPIPRTLAMTIYGDQDLSIIDELPPGRQEIITRIVPEYKRSDAYLWINEQVKKGRQVYVVCPLIDESDVLEVKAVTAEYERLQSSVFPNLRLALLHGKLPQMEKDEVMKNFSEGAIDVLVSTSVVEVGIDVPNATIMMIEGAERFGLSQLHQFRGRVGRGQHQSYCFLFPSQETSEIKERLQAMVKYSSGFKLAEIDLELRGPGEIYGVKQSGIPDLKMASFSDSDLIARARKEAEWLLEVDPLLEKFPLLKKKIEEFTEKRQG